MLSLEPRAGAAPTLVLAVGNPSRGDDALGPETARWLEAQGIAGVEVLVDFQCQVEHALDLAGRRRVVFVDASAALARDFELRPLAANPGPAFTTHALEPGAVLHHCHALTGAAPPEAWTLAIRGESFGLGEPLSAAARAHAQGARAALKALLESPLP